jgi:hypothetical protein
MRRRKIWMYKKHRTVIWVYTSYARIFFFMALQLFVGALVAFFNFLILHGAGMTFCTGYQPLTRLLPPQRTAQTRNKLTQTYMPRVGFEPPVSVFERAKTVYVFDRAATVIGAHMFLTLLNHQHLHYTNRPFFSFQIWYEHHSIPVKVNGFYLHHSIQTDCGTHSVTNWMGMGVEQSGRSWPLTSI